MVYKDEVDRLFAKAKDLLYLVCSHMAGVPEGCYVEIPLGYYKKIFDGLTFLCKEIGSLEGEDYPSIPPVANFADKKVLYEAVKALGDGCGGLFNGVEEG